MNKMNNKKTIISLIIIIVFFISYVFLNAQSIEPLATVTKIKGNPKIIKSNNVTSDIVIGTVVENGDTIITDSNSQVTLVFNDGEIRIITSDTNVKFDVNLNQNIQTKFKNIASTISDAVNTANLEKAFETVTGSKLSFKDQVEYQPQVAHKNMLDTEQSESLKTTEPKQKQLVSMKSPSPNQIDLGIDKSIKKWWGYWLDNSNSPKCNALISCNFKNESNEFAYKLNNKLNKINNLNDTFVISTNEVVTTIEVTMLYKIAKANEYQNICLANLNFDDKLNENIKIELNKISHLKDEDLETYLYIKAAILKKFKFYLAALNAINELEALYPNTKLLHALKTKVLIYHEMNENELMNEVLSLINK